MNSANSKNSGIDSALSRLLLVTTTSMRAARRKDTTSPKASPRSKRHAARFIKAFYDLPTLSDPEIRISLDGLLTLEWDKNRFTPQNGTKASGDITLVIDDNNGWELKACGREPMSGERADKNLARLIQALIEGNG